MSFEIPEIPTHELTKDQVPDVGVKDHNLNVFALTVPQSEVIENVGKFDEKADVDTMSLVHLRLLLYAEQRRWNHFGLPFDQPTSKRLRHALALIKQKAK